jgi:predicted RNase H-like HicB family nuclease
MRTVEDYVRQPWTIVVRHHDEEGGYWSARVAEIPGLLFCTGNRAELLPELDEVMRMWFEDALARGENIPEPATVSA